MKTMRNFDGERLTNEIARRQQSVPEFARDANISRLAVYRAMTGGKANVRTLGKLAAALGYQNPSELLQPAGGDKNDIDNARRTQD